MRKSFFYIGLTLAGFSLLAGLITWYPASVSAVRRMERDESRRWVARLGLTDLCLFTEATYLRHVTLADRFTAFQNYPLAPSLFPGESLLPPPAQMPAVVSADGGKASP